MRVALRIEVGTSRGMLEGVPNLLRLLGRYKIRGSFLFALGDEDAGRDPLRAWRRRRIDGVRALAFGTLQSAPDLAENARVPIADALKDGHEVGTLGLSVRAWRHRLAHADPDWVSEQCTGVWQRASPLLGQPPYVFATPDWQFNSTLLEQLTPGRCLFSSMTRGKLPYLGVSQGVRSQVPELPTTLPTIDEMIRSEGVDEVDVHGYLYAASQRVLPAGHVFTLHAEREGIDRLALFEKLLVMWRGQEGAVRALGDTLAELDRTTLPFHRIGWATPAGGSRPLATQSIEVPA